MAESQTEQRPDLRIRAHFYVLSDDALEQSRKETPSFSSFAK